jgi:two-component system response regulator HydG
VESELFGHRRGAFSGAQTAHPGLFAAAHRGTLFLDEIGELPLEAQAKLLRVLQDGEVRPVGSLESRRVDVRIIAASNRSLAAMGAGAMRQDLFFRLSVLVIEMPPLRERREDLPLLVAHFLARIRERGVARVESVDPHALELMLDYPFPGNVRELENMLEGVSLTLPPDRTTIRTDDVRGWLRHRGQSAAPPTAQGPSLRLHDLEVWAISEALRQTDGNKSRAAQLLGISRDTLYRKLQEMGLAADVSDSRT